jgi:ATP-binding cassette subfamily B protein
VSHRFSTVRMADVIVVLDSARLVEMDSRDELVGRGGEYAPAVRDSGRGLSLTAGCVVLSSESA